MWIFIARKILRNRISILVVIGLITLFMGYNARFVEMSYEYAPLLPKDDTAYIENQEFNLEFSSQGNLMVLGIKNSNFYNSSYIQHWFALIDSLKSIDGVTSVFSITEAYDIVKNPKEKKFILEPLFNKNQQYDNKSLDSLKNKINKLPFYKDLLYNEKNNFFLIAITLKPEILQSPARVALIDKIVKTGKEFTSATQNDLHYSGLPFIRVTTAEMIKKELNLFIIGALLVTAIIIFLFFRSFKVVMFSMLVVGIAVIWAVGIQELFGYKITILTGMIPPLIIVIGIPNSVFLLNKYHQEYKKHGNKIKALQRVIVKIGNATFLTNLTTASGFATFVFTSSKILVEFGVIAAVNILVVFFLSLCMIPIVFSFLDPPKERHLNHLNNQLIRKVVNGLVHISLNHRKAVYVFSFFVVIFGIWGITKVKTTGYMLDDIPHDNILYKDLKFFENNFNGLMPLDIMIDGKKGNSAYKTKMLKKIDKLEKIMSKKADVSRGISLAEAVKFGRQSFYKGNPKEYKVPSSMELNFILSYISNTNTKGSNKVSDVVNSFVDSLRSKTRLSYRLRDVGTVKMDALYKEITHDVDSLFPKKKYNTMVTGASVLFFKGTEYLIKNLFVSLALAIAIIATFMAWMFSSKRMVLVSLIPNLIPLITTAALMGYFGISIKPSTILVFSIAFGISVDDTIHFLAKYRQELSETKWSIKAAVVLALKETGVSMIYTSIILFFGFGIFGLSQFGGTVALGILVALTLLVALFSNLILLPTLLMSLERNITNRSFKEPSVRIYSEEDDDN